MHRVATNFTIWDSQEVNRLLVKGVSYTVKFRAKAWRAFQLALFRPTAQQLWVPGEGNLWSVGSVDAAVGLLPGWHLDQKMVAIKWTQVWVIMTLIIAFLRQDVDFQGPKAWALTSTVSEGWRGYPRAGLVHHARLFDIYVQLQQQVWLCLPACLLCFLTYFAVRE